MQSRVVHIASDEASLFPFGDLHVGDKNFNDESRRRLTKMIDLAAETKHSRVFLMGDLVNTATLTSASSVFEQKYGLTEQIDEVVSMFDKLRGRIIGAIDGNHEQRMYKHAGYSPTSTIAKELGSEHLGASAVIRFVVGKKNKRGFTTYFHHTTGGGSTMGAAINRIKKLSEIVVNADLYVGGHSHQQVISHAGCLVYDEYANTTIFKKQSFVNSGSYLAWDGGYAEEKQLSIARLGSPVIIMRAGKDGGIEVRT